MSEEAKAATDELIEAWRAGGGANAWPLQVMALIARIDAEVRARKAAEEKAVELNRRVMTEIDDCAVCDVESCRHAGADHEFQTPRQRIVDLERLLAEQRSRADVAEQEIEDEIQRRDRYHDAVTEAHVALGGDGEWRAHVGGSPEPPHSGHLHLDVPVMARQLRERIAALEAELAEAKARADEPCTYCDAAGKMLVVQDKRLAAAERLAEAVAAYGEDNLPRRVNEALRAFEETGRPHRADNGPEPRTITKAEAREMDPPFPPEHGYEDYLEDFEKESGNA